MEEVYKPNRRMYNLFAKDYSDNEWCCIYWGTIEDCLDYARKLGCKDDDYVILPVGYKLQ